MNISLSCLSDKGKERTCNEDAFIACLNLNEQNWDVKATDGFVPCNETGTLIVVVDGIGGAGSGDVAADIAIRKVRETFTRSSVEDAIKKQAYQELMKKAVEVADQAICQHVEMDFDTMGMGCTILMAWLNDHRVHITWAGDSRGYIFSPRQGLKRLTKDHSLVQQMVDRGEITQEEAFIHPDNNIITRSIGDCDVDKQPEYVEIEINDGDVILLCSDGLCGYCSDKDIEKGMRMKYGNTMEMSAKLLEMALNAGGGDNICIAIIAVACDENLSQIHLSIWQKIVDFFKIKRPLVEKM